MTTNEMGRPITKRPGMVTGGTIDVIGSPGYDPRLGNGHYIDMQGSAGQPTIH